ncbi:hypothetical protein BBJ28_00025550, partial [Nothophytophthora sp. Chile5]
SLKPSKVTKSQLVPCTICAIPVPHAMRYKQLACTCSECKKVAPYTTCPWLGKVLICQVARIAAVSEADKHITVATASRKMKLTEPQKEFAREMAKHGMKPAHVRNAMRSKFRLDDDDLPTLRQVQNFVNHFSKSKLGANDRCIEINTEIRSMAYCGTEADAQSFSFAWEEDADGHPLMGNGSDDRPFLVGLTTKRLLRRMDRDPSTFVFHMDATFKLNQVGYPVFVCGISDKTRSFHLVAIFVTSQRQVSEYEAALAALRRVYTRVTSKQLALKYVMGDADDAQYNGFQSVFAMDCNLTYMMCFYHVMAKVIERTRGLQASQAAVVTRDIYDLHFSRSDEAYEDRKEDILSNWGVCDELLEFSAYFKKQWLVGKFRLWQCYQSPSGHATTNNPVEQFNRLLKRDYTQRRQLKMGMLIKQLAACCTDQSMSTRPFQLVTEASSTLNNRVKEFRRQGLLTEFNPRRGTLEYLLHDAQPNIAHIRSEGVQRVYVPSRNRTQEVIAISAGMGVQYARMERQGQPPTGWEVDVRCGVCPCNYFFKFGSCIHLSFALQVRNVIDSDGNARLVYRGVNKRKRGQDSVMRGALVGRPPNNGHALDIQ